MTNLSRLGLLACSWGWHRGPFGKEPRPPGVAPEDFRFACRYYCRRCGQVGRLDVHGHLETDGDGGAAEGGLVGLLLPSPTRVTS
jgi:hypothetical protein